MQIRVVDEDDHDVPAGEVGEIAVRGTTVMNGYWNRAELNAERSRNGWHHTNDLGRYEADGTFSFIAPKGRMLKSAAENIYPAEVENAVRSHPAVADCAVIGVPDDTWVQAVKAIVVVVDGHDRSRRRDHRVVPQPHRVVQEAADRRVRRRAPARRLLRRLRRARPPLRRRQLPGRSHPQRVSVSPGVAPAGGPGGTRDARAAQSVARYAANLSSELEKPACASGVRYCSGTFV